MKQCNLDYLRDVQRQIEQTDNFSSQRRQELLNHVNDFIRKATAVGNVDPNVRTLSGTAREVKERLTQQLATAQVLNLSPKLGRNFAHYLAHMFDVKRKALGLADGLTQPGAVRELIQTMNRKGFGEIRDLVAAINMQDLAIQADQVFNRMRKKYNIPQKPFEIFKLEMAEIPNHPYVQSTFNIMNPAGIEFLRGRQQRVLDFAEQFKISRTDMDAMANASRKVTDTYAELRQTIDVFNIRMGDANLEDIQRYIPRQFSQEATSRIYRQKAEDSRGVFRNIFDGEPKTVREMFVQSRQTDYYIPEDEALVDFVLTSADKNIYSKLSVATGIEVNDISDLIADNGMFVRAFTDYFDRNPKTTELFDQLVDSGLVAKIPMSSAELYDYIMTRYNMPFSTPKEMMNVSFETQVQIYRKQLEQLAGRAMAAQFVGRAAVEGNWGVTKAVIDADPVTYRDFKPLVGISRGPDGGLQPGVGAIPPDFALRFGMVGPSYENVYLHPVAADNISAMLEIGTSPNKLGIAARVIERINTIFKSQALATTGFVARQFINNLIQTTASGGALNIYAQDTLRVMGKLADIGFNRRSIDNLSEAFDNKARIYNGMTERELWHRLRQDGFIEEIMPLAAANLNNLNYQPDFGPGRAIANQFRYSRDVWSRLNDTSDLLKAIEQQTGQTTRVVSNLSSRFFYNFQQLGSLFDQTARLSVMKSLMASPTNAAGEATMSISQRARAAYEGPISRGAFGNFQRTYTYNQALEHAKKYFFSYQDLGEADKLLNRYLVPFWSFTSRNTFSVFKKMVREPHTFVAYQRVHAALNQPAADQGENYPAAGEADWLSETRPIRYVTEDGDFFAIPLTSLDPISEGVQKISDIGDSFLSAIGVDIKAKSPEAELNRLLSSRSNRGLENLVASSYPAYKSLYGAIAGINPDTGRPFRVTTQASENDTFLGVRVTPFWRWQLETWSPLLARVNNSNPGGVFGRPDRFENGVLVQEGTPAWLTGNARTQRDVVRDYQDWRLRAASMLGVNIRPVDVAYDMGYQQTGLSIAMNNAKTQMREQRAYIRTLTDEADIREAREKYMEMQQLYTMLRIDLADVTAWAEERNIPLNRAIQRIKQEELELRQIQTLTDEERFQELQDIHGDLLNER